MDKCVHSAPAAGQCPVARPEMPHAASHLHQSAAAAVNSSEIERPAQPHHWTTLGGAYSGCPSPPNEHRFKETYRTHVRRRIHLPGCRVVSARCRAQKWPSSRRCAGASIRRPVHVLVGQVQRRQHRERSRLPHLAAVAGTRRWTACASSASPPSGATQGSLARDRDPLLQGDLAQSRQRGTTSGCRVRRSRRSCCRCALLWAARGGQSQVHGGRALRIRPIVRVPCRRSGRAGSASGARRPGRPAARAQQAWLDLQRVAPGARPCGWRRGRCACPPPSSVRRRRR